MDRTKTITGAAYQQESCAEYMVKLYAADGYQAQQFQFDDNGTRGTVVQIRNTSSGFWSGVKRWTGLETCAMVRLVAKGDDLEIQVEAGRWLDKAALAAVGMFGVFIVLWPLLITSATGAVRQKSLLDRVFIDVLGFFSGAK